MNRTEIAQIIAIKLRENSNELSESYQNSGNIPYFFIDDLLPETVVQSCFKNFPEDSDMTLKKSLKEDKYISAQMDKHAPILEEVLFAFQEPEVVQEVEKITGFQDLLPDEKLYAGGLSRMNQHQFLKPHLDNSHDKEGNRYRVLNLLYYVNPNWQSENGGNLELWPEGLKKDPVEIISTYNRLVVMATHKHSLHSVNEIVSNQSRFCISNYYFHENSPENQDYFHVTTFYNRKNVWVNTYFQIDAKIREILKAILPQTLRKNPHFYKKSGK